MREMNVYMIMDEIMEVNEEMALAQQALFKWANDSPVSQAKYKMEWAKAYLAVEKAPVATREALADSATIELYEKAEIDKSLEKATRANLDRLGKRLMSLQSILSTMRAELNALHAPSDGI